jgi:putative ABC transport system ATP-binding protein
MDAETPVVIEHLDHYFGEGSLRRQILYDISTEIQRGEVVILTGPSGSGKTTLLTLIGGLRSAQQGRLRVLGQELNGATERQLVQVRQNMGYVFQAHNLLVGLPVRSNVELALELHPELSTSDRRTRSLAMLQAVGLGERAEKLPQQLSTGEKQRVAIARALVSRPQLILADEPTASLDKQAGRTVVELLHDLAKQQGCTVLLVTHDTRILDIADRIIHLEDGRLHSLTDAVLSTTQKMFGLLTQSNRSGELSHRLTGLPEEQFVSLLDDVTVEFQRFLHMIDLSNTAAFESMLEQVIEAFTVKVGQLLRADRATLFLVDAERGELWSKVAQSGGEKSLDIRIPITAGIAGKVAATGKSLNIPDAYDEPLFNREVDDRTGYRTRSILCVPIVDRQGRTFAVAQLLNKASGVPFDAADERRFHELATSLGVILESWWRMSHTMTPAALSTSRR